MSRSSTTSAGRNGVPSRRTMAAVALVTFAGAGIALWFIAPRFAEIFEQAKFPMPEPTERVLSLMRFACGFPHVWVGITLCLPWWFHRKGGRLGEFGLIVMGSLGISLMLWITYSLFLPLIGTLEGVSSAGR